MAYNQTRKAISIPGTTFAQLTEMAAEHGTNASALTTALIEQLLAKRTTRDIALEDLRRQGHLRACGTRRRGGEIQSSEAPVEAAPDIRPDGVWRNLGVWRPEVPVDEGTMSMIDDIVVRERELHGREVTPSHVLDAAINRTLDALGAPR